MATKDHPQFAAWTDALANIIAAERRSFDVVAANEPDNAKQMAMQELHEVRQEYRDIADNLHAPPHQTKP
jgi:hypothetical protein